MPQLSKDFNSTEFASHYNGVTTPVPPPLMPHLQRLADNLQVLRDAVGRGITINSGYRTVAHNAAVGGKIGSQHLDAAAADFTIEGMAPSHAYCMVKALIKDGQMREGGLGAYVAHTHYDPRGTPARWTTGITEPDCSEVSVPEDKKEDNMAVLLKREGSGGAVWLFTGASLTRVSDKPAMDRLRELGVVSDKPAKTITAAKFNALQKDLGLE